MSVVYNFHGILQNVKSRNSIGFAYIRNVMYIFHYFMLKQMVDPFRYIPKEFRV